MSLWARTPIPIWDISADGRITSNPIYICIITGAADGLEDIEVPIESFTATISTGIPSYLSVVIPAADDIETEIIARKNGDVVIYNGFRFSTGVEQVEEIARGAIDSYQKSMGGRYASLVVSGYKDIPLGTPKERNAVNISSFNMLATGKRTITAELDLFLRCGDTYIYGAGGTEYITVGTIEYTVNLRNAQADMTAKEL
jgi:hypothetical protein